MREFPGLHTVGLDRSLAWLAGVPPPISRIAVFGCNSSEPFALIVHLRAANAVVLELDRSHLTQGNSLSVIEEAELLSRLHPIQFQSSSVHFVVGDMRRSPFADAQFDLAFCENVLYYFTADNQSLLQAISQMVRLVRPGGWIIAVEPKFGVPHRFIETPLGRMPVPEGPAADMSPTFDNFPLQPHRLREAPPHAYCFQKAENGRAA